MDGWFPAAAWLISRCHWKWEVSHFLFFQWITLINTKWESMALWFACCPQHIRLGVNYRLEFNSKYTSDEHIEVECFLLLLSHSDMEGETSSTNLLNFFFILSLKARERSWLWQTFVQSCYSFLAWRRWKPLQRIDILDIVKLQYLYLQNYLCLYKGWNLHPYFVFIISSDYVDNSLRDFCKWTFKNLIWLSSYLAF